MKLKSGKAFTLVELLVTIAIIGILAALLLPALARGKASAQRVACINSLRQWAMAAHSYEEDHQKLPREYACDNENPWLLVTAPTNSDVWYNALPPHMSKAPASEYAPPGAPAGDFYSSASMFHCPAAKFTLQANGYPQFSLAMNSKLMGAERVSMSAIEEPTRTALFLDEGVPGESKAFARQSDYNGQPHAFASRFSGRHGRRGNIAMAGGNVETLATEKVVVVNLSDPYAGRAVWPATAVIWRTVPDENPNLPFF